MKNIRTFLKVCHDKFGLRNSELFDPFDLFDVRDFGKVSGLFPGWAPPRRARWAGAGLAVLQTGGGASGAGAAGRPLPPLRLLRV